MKLAGQVAVATGAGRGIGHAIAKMRAREGAKVALIVRTAAEIEAVAEAISAAGGTARAYSIDVVDGMAVAEAFAAIEGDLGAVRLLTNNAGAFSAYGPIWTVDSDEWRRDLETNVFGTCNCCRAALTAMIARGRDARRPPQCRDWLSRFDRMAGRMLMAGRGDLDLDEPAIEQIICADLRSLRVNGMPQEL